jgi:hypothetical protein
MRSDFSTFFLLERRAIGRVGGHLVLAQMFAGVVGVLQQLAAQFEQHLLEEQELRFIHVVFFGRLEDFLFGQLADFLDGGCGFDCHASFT